MLKESTDSKYVRETYFLDGKGRYADTGGMLSDDIEKGTGFTLIRDKGGKEPARIVFWKKPNRVRILETPVKVKNNDDDSLLAMFHRGNGKKREYTKRVDVIAGELNITQMCAILKLVFEKEPALRDEFVAEMRNLSMKGGDIDPAEATPDTEANAEDDDEN